MDIEKKLATYRAEKEREAKIKKYKENISHLITVPRLWFKKEKKKDTLEKHSLIAEEKVKEEEKTLANNEDVLDESNIEDTEISLNCCTKLQLVYYCLYFTLWVILYIIFIKLEFGIVYFTSSLLVFIYLNTRTRPKKPNEVSAYSVFNENCESIDGTLKAEQLEREMIYGFAAVR